MSQVVTREVVLPATTDEVWEALVDPAELRDWFGAEVDLDVRPGGAASFRGDDGDVRLGVIEEVEPGSRLTYRWWPEDAEQEASRVTFTVDAVPSGTRLIVVEAPVTAAPLHASACASGSTSAAWDVRCTRLVWCAGRIAVRV